MKKIWTFILGMITGAILFCLASYCITYKPWSKSPMLIPGLTIFETAGDVLPYKSFEVLQVLPNGSVLVKSSKYNNESSYISCPISYMLAPQTGGYYDDQVLKVPVGKIVRQIGTYNYTTGGGFDKTVPVIGFYDQ